MLYLDDKLARHPKIMKAGELLGGGDGPGRALALFLDALSYAREHLTDGFIPISIVKASPLVRDPIKVARSLATAKLWIRVPHRGYQFRDYFDWNPSAKKVKNDRQKWRKKKRRQRRQNGKFGSKFQHESRVPPGTELSPRDSRRDSRARAVPRPVPVQISQLGDPGTSTAGVQTAHCVRGIFGSVENRRPPTHRVLCAMLRAELAADPSLGNAIEGVKRRLVAQGFDYPAGDALDGALQAVERARRKASA